jgi:DNA polymerase (family 10)
MKNREIADIFEKMALMLEFKGEIVFKINAYHKAARILRDITEDVEALHREGKLSGIPGIGKGLADKIGEYLSTGAISKYQELKRDVSDDMLYMMRVQGVGPKTAALVHEKLKVEDIADLEQAIRAGLVRELPGMGPKKEENILRGIQLLRESEGRVSLGVALPLAEELIAALKEETGIERIAAAGSLRRMKETVGDIDILTAGSEGQKIIQAFTRLPMVRDVLAAGETKGSVITEGGIQADLRVVAEDSYGAALQYFTGSVEHNVKLRGIAQRMGFKINEYGVFKGDEKLCGANEEDIYEAVGLCWIPPELREDRGEVEAAVEGALPSLVSPEDIKGDLHVHSSWSDGSASIEDMARKAMSMGYQYLVITDHSKSLRIGNGLHEKDLYLKLEEMEKVQGRLKGIAVLSGTEVDIMNDGSLDYPDELLSRLDIVVAAIHSGFKQEEEQLTMRTLKAMENPHVDVIAHPTGRLIGTREAYKIDMARVIEVAAETGTAIEVNSYPERMDLDDAGCLRAKNRGVKVAVNTDSHHPDQMWIMRLGVAVARRGWLGPEDVVNTFPLEKLLKWTEKKT